MQSKKVIIDTNFLLIPGQFKVDIFSEIERVMQEPHEVYIVEKTMEELQRIVMAAGRDDKFAAKLAQVLVTQKGLKRLASSKGLKTADDDIVDISDENTYVATQDAILRKRVKAKGAKTIGLRQKKYLAVMD
jgi:rRNA-processing protein FCF1